MINFRILLSGVLYKLSNVLTNISREYVMYSERQSVSLKYLHGCGIEIGAMHRPVVVPNDAHVTYVDKLSEGDLRKQFPHLISEHMVKVDVVDDGEKLEKFKADSQDFVIANHLLEHCENPIGTIYNMLRVLREGGVVYLAIPDKRYTFDVERPITSLDHCIKDYEQGPEWSRRAHWEEVIRILNKVEENEEVDRQFEKSINNNCDTHYHVWTQIEILEFITYLKRSLHFKFEVELLLKNHIEVVLVLRKTT